MSKEFQIRDGNLIASFDLENEDGDIDCCKLFKVSHGVADEIGMFVDYVATNKIIKDQSNQIADLEAKLAESEEKCEEFKQVISKCTGELPPNVAFDIANDDIRFQIVCTLTDRNQEHRKTIRELKQQLAEKDEAIEELKANLFAERLDKEYDCILGLQNAEKDKISFVIDELEKVKEHNDNVVCDDEYYYKYITAYIDLRIADLTHQHEDKGE